jgi:class 3 adenylate cyclase
MGVLGEYHAAMGRLILEHEGTLERFSGDGIMVFFNDPVQIADPAPRAARMVLSMQREIGACRALEEARLRPADGRRHRAGLRDDRRHRLSPGGSTTARSAPSRTWRRACAARRAAARRCCRSASWPVSKKASRPKPAGELVLKGFHKPVPAYRLLDRPEN